MSDSCNPTPGSSVWDSPGKNTGVGCHLLLLSSDLPVPVRERYPTEGSALGSLLTEQMFSTVELPWGEAACAVTRTPSPHLIAYCICVISASQWRGWKWRLPTSTESSCTRLFNASSAMMSLAGMSVGCTDSETLCTISDLSSIPPFTQHPNCAPSSSLTNQSTHLPFSRRPWMFLSQETSLFTGRWIVEWLSMGNEKFTLITFKAPHLSVTYIAPIYQAKSFLYQAFLPKLSTGCRKSLGDYSHACVRACTHTHTHTHIRGGISDTGDGPVSGLDQLFIHCFCLLQVFLA